MSRHNYSPLRNAVRAPYNTVTYLRVPDGTSTSKYAQKVHSTAHKVGSKVSVQTIHCRRVGDQFEGELLSLSEVIVTQATDVVEGVGREGRALKRRRANKPSTAGIHPGGKHRYPEPPPPRTTAQINRRKTAKHLVIGDDPYGDLP